MPLLIRYGFPLDFDRSIPLQSHPENHTFAKNYPKDVRAYLQEEIGYTTLINMHVSPFMIREKPNATNRRIIVNLSFPQGQSENAGSVKDMYLNTPFVLKLPIVDHITKCIKLLDKSCMIYKIDIKRAFRHVKLDPKDYASRPNGVARPTAASVSSNPYWAASCLSVNVFVRQDFSSTAYCFSSEAQRDIHWF